MPAEIEAKLKVDDFNPLRKRLRERGAIRVGLTHEVNTFYDDANHSLRTADRGLRIRQNRHESGQVEYIITVKGPQQSGDFKNREEAEVKVADGNDAAAVLRGLGYQPTLSFEKRRESWKLEGCKVELDELPILGRFVEIEGPDADAVSKVGDLLGLANTASIKTSYISMLARYLDEKHDTRRAITF
jgi:adenylate cyclase class 2